ncbi:MAG: hypothetical protein AAGM16_10575 [Pseudomonadota bacterium]
MKYKIEELQAAFDGLVAREHLAKATVGALIATLPAFIYYPAIFWLLGYIYAFLLLAPGIIVGLGARLAGKPFRMAPRVVAAVIAFAVHVLAATFLLELHPVFQLLAPLNAGIAFALSKVNLSHVEEMAISYEQVGKLERPAFRGAIGAPPLLLYASLTPVLWLYSFAVFDPALDSPLLEMARTVAAQLVVSLLIVVLVARTTGRELTDSESTRAIAYIAALPILRELALVVLLLMGNSPVTLPGHVGAGIGVAMMLSASVAVCVAAPWAVLRVLGPRLVRALRRPGDGLTSPTRETQTP